MFYQLPPVGDSIGLTYSAQAEVGFAGPFLGYTARFFDSGTAALAAALQALNTLQGGGTGGEVLLPGYGCPALVSAVLHAGLQPVLVDLEEDRPWLDLRDLAAKISARTRAVVAVDLFGIPERREQIQAISRAAGVSLIEDSAQYMPARPEDHWQGDFVVLSFGRGKPVSLLGGGAVLVRDAALADALPGIPGTTESRTRAALHRLKVAAHNALLHPRFYWFPQALPFLGLGETRYVPLDGIGPMSPRLLQALPGEMQAYRQRGRRAQTAIAGLLRDLPTDTLVDLPRACSALQAPLLRYPILVNEARLRERLFLRLRAEGLGVSKMYPEILPRIPGLTERFPATLALPQARQLAHRILTLPTHERVGARDIASLRRVFEALFDPPAAVGGE
jgi:dTDP-4-amino-4,6-dideoxygalactose transaminase